jgi:hypothetical protein
VQPFLFPWAARLDFRTPAQDDPSLVGKVFSVTEIEEIEALGPDGLFEVHRVKSGIAYYGWYLVACVTPRTRGGAEIETAFLGLDPQVGPNPRPVPGRQVVGIGPGTPWRSLLDTQVDQALRTLHGMLDEWGRNAAMPDPAAPKATKASPDDLRILYMSTIPMPEDDPFRHLRREGLARLRRETGCRALQHALDSFMPVDARVERD